MATLAFSGAARGEESKGIVDVKPADGPAVEVDGSFMVPYTVDDSQHERQLRNDPRSPAASSCSAAPRMKPTAATRRAAGAGEGRAVWIGKHEVTCAEYQAYMKMYNAFKQFADPLGQSLGRTREERRRGELGARRRACLEGRHRQSRRRRRHLSHAALHARSHLHGGRPADSAGGDDDALLGAAVHQVAERPDRPAVPSAERG